MCALVFFVCVLPVPERHRVMRWDLAVTPACVFFVFVLLSLPACFTFVVCLLVSFDEVIFTWFSMFMSTFFPTQSERVQGRTTGRGCAAAWHTA
jgi:hypothetical protein